MSQVIDHKSNITAAIEADRKYHERVLELAKTGKSYSQSAYQANGEKSEWNTKARWAVSMNPAAELDELRAIPGITSEAALQYLAQGLPIKVATAVHLERASLERQELLAEKNQLLAEKQRLTAEANHRDDTEQPDSAKRAFFNVVNHIVGTKGIKRHDAIVQAMSDRPDLYAAHNAEILRNQARD
jgi:hypothetical protein